MSRLYDTCVYRADGNLKESFAVGYMDVIAALTPRLGVLRHVLQQRVKALREALMEYQWTRVGVSLGDYAEHVLYFTLVPGCRRKHVGQCGEAVRHSFFEHGFQCFHFMCACIFKDAVYRQAFYVFVPSLVASEHCCKRVCALCRKALCRLRKLRGLYKFNFHRLHQRAPPITIPAAFVKSSPRYGSSWINPLTIPLPSRRTSIARASTRPISSPAALRFGLPPSIRIAW